MVWQDRPDYRKMRKGDKIRFRGRTGTLKTTPEYKTGEGGYGRAWGLHFADVKWDDGTVQRDMMLCRRGLSWKPKKRGTKKKVRTTKGTPDLYTVIMASPIGIAPVSFEGKTKFPKAKAEELLMTLQNVRFPQDADKFFLKPADYILQRKRERQQKLRKCKECGATTNLVKINEKPEFVCRRCWDRKGYEYDPTPWR